MTYHSDDLCCESLQQTAKSSIHFKIICFLFIATQTTTDPFLYNNKIDFATIFDNVRHVIFICQTLSPTADGIFGVEDQAPWARTDVAATPLTALDVLSFVDKGEVEQAPSGVCWSARVVAVAVVHT